eukprot:Opistho-2@39497
MSAAAKESVAEVGKTLIRSLKRPSAIKKNFFDVVNDKPQFGVGLRVSRSIWRRYDEEKCHWQITKVALSPDLRHGKAYGILTWKGITEQTAKRIPSVLKPYWFIVGQAPDVPIDLGSGRGTATRGGLFKMPPPRPTVPFSKPTKASPSAEKK